MATIKEEEYPIKDSKFEYMEVHYDCKRAIKKDIKLIIQEAEETHKNSFDELYDRSTLRPSFVRLFVDVNDAPIYGMVIYTIDYKELNERRKACGNYYPVNNFQLSPHNYQASICW